MSFGAWNTKMKKKKFEPGFYTVKQIENIVNGLTFKDKKQRVETVKKKKTLVNKEYNRKLEIIEVKPLGKWVEIRLNNGKTIKIRNY